MSYLFANSREKLQLRHGQWRAPATQLNEYLVATRELVGLGPHWLHTLTTSTHG